MRKPDSGPKKAHVIHDLGHGSHGGAGIMTALFLIYANGGRQSFNAITIGLLHLTEELSRVGT